MQGVKIGEGAVIATGAVETSHPMQLLVEFRQKLLNSDRANRETTHFKTLWFRWVLKMREYLQTDDINALTMKI